jgi:hypothetical protein
MNHKSRMLVAVVAALVLSGALASQALATETLSFISQSGLYPIKSVTVKSHSGYSIEFYQEKTGYYGCGSLTGEGEFTSHKAGKMKFTFKECNLPTGGKCQSSELTPGEIKTGTLPVELVYTNKAKHEAALDLNYEEPTEVFPPPTRKTFAKWECRNGLATTKSGIRGSILVPITPVNTQSNAFKLGLVAEKGVQTPSSYETEAGKVYKAFPETALISTTEFYSEGAVGSMQPLELTTPKIEGTFEVKA